MQRTRIEIEKALEHFTHPQKEYVHDIIDFSTDQLHKKTDFFLFKCAGSIDENTSDYKKDMFIDIIEQVFIKDTEDNVDILSSGENFFIELRLRKDEDLTGSALVARLDEDDSALSDKTLKGNSDAIQRLDCLDLDLTTGTFHRINVLTEGIDSNGSANGNGIALINIVYLYVIESIDQ